MIQFDGHAAAVYSLAFSPDSALLATAGKDGVRVWDAAGGLAYAGPTDLLLDRHRLGWTPTGRGLLVTTKSGLATVSWDGGGEATAFDLPPALLPVNDFGFLTDDLLAVGGGRFVQLFDTKTRGVRANPRTEQKGVHRLVTHPGTKTVAWTNGEHRLRVWLTTSPDVLDMTLGKPTHALAVSPDGTRFAVGVDYAVRLYLTGVRHPAAELTGHKGRVSGAAFAAGGRMLATVSWDESVRLWDVATARETARFPLKVGGLTAVAVSPDGTRIAVASNGGPVVVIDAE